MNIIILATIKEAEAKMSAYNALLSYRFMNLCVKAEAASLLPVTVYSELGSQNLEDAAFVNQPNEYQLGVFPKNEMFLKNIMEGIKDVHPEFKLEVQTIKNSDNQEMHYLLYTMPDVDKDRRDLLQETTKVFYEDCKLNIEKVYGQYTLSLAKSLKDVPEDLDEAKKELDKACDGQKEAIAKLLDDKQNEIEEAYQRYLLSHPENSGANDGGQEFDVTHSMRFPTEEYE